MERHVSQTTALAILAIAALAYAVPVSAGKNTVTLCHVADGNPHTILVNENAIDAHLAHGDTIGPCGLQPPVCGPGTAACGDECEDLTTDENHCGACGFACPIGAYCIEGNCVEVSSPPTCADADGDGVLDAACGGTDCDDQNYAVFPGAEEICDALDNDCNGVIDDRDQDRDLHILESCISYNGVLPVDDCLDTNDGVFPGTPEVCGDDFDNNCDGNLNEACPSDCSNPGIEICDGIDNDCNGPVDDVPSDQIPYCSNQQGVCSGSVQTCGGSYGWLTCGVTNYQVNSPYYEDVEVSCDGLDNDCDGLTDEICP